MLKLVKVVQQMSQEWIVVKKLSKVIGIVKRWLVLKNLLESGSETG